MDDLLKKLKDLDNIMDIQLNDPSNKYDSYMRGLSNGLIMADAIIKGIEPKFIEPVGRSNEQRSLDELFIKLTEVNWKQAVATGMIGLSVLGGIDSPDAIAKAVDTKQVQSIDQNNIVAKVIAGEAAGEGHEGMIAVANVIQNRAKLWHDDVLNVVMKPKQFSAYADKALMDRNYKDVKTMADEIASQIGKLDDITGGATHYVTNELYARKKNDPKSWISKMTVTKVIGDHTFMKEQK